MTDDRINLLYNLLFKFSTQLNVVGAKLAVAVAISKIFKYQKKTFPFQTKIHTNSSIVGLPA
jgi:hypothetical protein